MSRFNKRKLKSTYGGKGWTMVNEKELTEAGFDMMIIEGKDTYYHEVLSELLVILDPDTKAWYLKLNGITLRAVTYMYQIDNMIHGFTDRWRGYV